MGGAQMTLAEYELGVLLVQNEQQNITTNQEIPRDVVLTGGHTGHK